MSPSLNRAELIGRLGADPEISYPAADLAVCVFWLVTEDQWKDETSATYTVVEWHRIVAWARLGEDAHNFFVRGDLLYVEGRLTSRAWHDEMQQLRVVTELVADRCLPLHRDPDSPNQRDTIYIPENHVRMNELYMPPTEPDMLTQKKLF